MVRLFLLALGMVLFGFVGPILAVEVVTIDWPVYNHEVFIDFPDPDRPGHQKGIIVSGPELAVKSTLAVGCTLLSVWLWRCGRRLDPKPKPEVK